MDEQGQAHGTPTWNDCWQVMLCPKYHVWSGSLPFSGTVPTPRGCPVCDEQVITLLIPVSLFHHESYAKLIATLQHGTIGE